MTDTIWLAIATAAAGVLLGLAAGLLVDRGLRRALTREADHHAAAAALAENAWNATVEERETWRHRAEQSDATAATRETELEATRSELTRVRAGLAEACDLLDGGALVAPVYRPVTDVWLPDLEVADVVDVEDGTPIFDQLMAALPDLEVTA